MDFETNREIITILSDNELMQLFHLAQELRRGEVIKKIKQEFSRRVREA